MIKLSIALSFLTLICNLALFIRGLSTVLGKSHHLVAVLVVFVMSTALVATEDVFALGNPGLQAEVVFGFDIDSVKGFEKATLDPEVGSPYIHDVMNPDGSNPGLPTFVLRQGATGSFNITLSSSDWHTIIVRPLRYGGDAAANYSGWNVWLRGRDLPDGISYSFEPNGTTTLTHGDNKTITMRITAAPDAKARIYNLSIIRDLEAMEGPPKEGVVEFYDMRALRTILTIVDSNSSSTVAVNATGQEPPPCIGTPPSDGALRAAYADYTAEPYLAQTASKSDSIVLGTVTGIANTTVLGDGEVYTHYLFSPSVYLKEQQQGLQQNQGNHQLLISKLGGSCGSYKMTVFDDFEIKVGETYVMFISSRTGQNGVAYGWQGIYPVIGGKIYSMLSAGRGGPDIPTSRMVNGWSLEQFKDEIEKQITVKTSTQTSTETLTAIVNGTSTATTTTRITTTVVTSASGSEAPTFAWALSATVATVVLAAVLFLRRKRK